PAQEPAHGVGGLVQVGAQHPALAAQLGQQAQHRLGAEDHVGAGEQVAGPGGQTRQAVATDTNDVDARFGVAHGWPRAPWYAGWYTDHGAVSPLRAQADALLSQVLTVDEVQTPVTGDSAAGWGRAANAWTKSRKAPETRQQSAKLNTGQSNR